VKQTKRFLAAAVFFCALPLWGSAAPLRTMTYHFTMDARGFYGSASMSQYGAASDNGYGESAAASGTIRVDVIRATEDGGLVVDLTEHVDRQMRDMQTLRCAVYGRDQSVICDQNLDATPEQNVLLQYLGRFFYEPSRVDSKGHWHVSTPMRNEKVDDDYTVTKTDGNLLTISISRAQSMASFESKTSGEMTYDAALEAPQWIKVATSSIDSGSQGDINCELKILSDSMAPQTGQNSH
jgi:hypothetical protein